MAMNMLSALSVDYVELKELPCRRTIRVLGGGYISTITADIINKSRRDVDSADNKIIPIKFKNFIGIIFDLCYSKKYSPIDNRVNDKSKQLKMVLEWVDKLSIIGIYQKITPKGKGWFYAAVVSNGDITNTLMQINNKSYEMFGYFDFGSFKEKLKNIYAIHSPYLEGRRIREISLFYCLRYAIAAEVVEELSYITSSEFANTLCKIWQLNISDFVLSDVEKRRYPEQIRVDNTYDFKYDTDGYAVYIEDMNLTCFHNLPETVTYRIPLSPNSCSAVVDVVAVKNLSVTHFDNYKVRFRWCKNLTENEKMVTLETAVSNELSHFVPVEDPNHVKIGELCKSFNLADVYYWVDRRDIRIWERLIKGEDVIAICEVIFDDESVDIYTPYDAIQKGCSLSNGIIMSHMLKLDIEKGKFYQVDGVVYTTYARSNVIYGDQCKEFNIPDRRCECGFISDNNDDDQYVKCPICNTTPKRFRRCFKSYAVHRILGYIDFDSAYLVQ